MAEERGGRKPKGSERHGSGRRAAIPEEKPRRKTFIHLLILAAVSFGLYATALGNDFVTDDTLQLQANPFVKSFRYIPRLFGTNVWEFLHSTITNYYRPVQMVIYMGEYYLFGFKPWAFHFVNLLLNVAVVIAAYFLIRTLADERLALWASLLFAFHPIHVEAVVWIAALPELLCALCIFLGVRLYHRARSGIQPARNYAIATAVFFVGMFCKETTLIFPVLLAAYEFFYRRETVRAIAAGFARSLPYVGALAIYVAVRVKVLGTFAPAVARFSRLQVMLSAPVLLAQYILKAVWPVNMNYYYHFTPTSAVGAGFVASVALVAALVAAMFWLRKPQPLLAFAMAWFFISIAPVLDADRVGENVFTERYLYIPTLGVCILGGWAWLRIREKLSRRVELAAAYPALALVLIFCTALIELRIPDWSSDLRLFQKTVLQSPDSPTVQVSLGIAYYQAGQYEAAIAPLQRSLELRPGGSLAHLYMALVLSSLGETQEASAHLAQATQLNTKGDLPWSLYAQAYANMKQWDRAIECDRKEIELEPQNPVLYAALGEALEANGQAGESMAALRHALELDPGFLDASTNLAITLAQQGNTDDAIATLSGSLQKNPKGPHADAAWFNLGNIYAHGSRWSDAAAAYQHAIDVNPEFDAARERLASVQAQMTLQRK